MIFVGEGRVEAYGGRGYAGGNADSGSSGHVDNSSDSGYGGRGGNGGYGGGGAGAGIGTSGGYGGNGGSAGGTTSFSYDRHKDYKWYNGSSASSGGTGSGSSSMGNLYIMGKVSVTAQGGSYGTGAGDSGSNDTSVKKGDYYKFTKGTTYGSAAGGGGGAGGGTGYPAANIGSGGSGAGGGGGGGGGGARCDNDGHKSAYTMWGGAGSGGTGYYSGYSNYRSAGSHGGSGGSGGGSRESGSGGRVYKMSTASVSSVGGASSGRTGKGATVYTGKYSPLNVTLKLVDNKSGLQGPTLSDNNAREAYAHIRFTDTAWVDDSLSWGDEPFSYTGYTLDGWYTEDVGGTKILDANGNIVQSVDNICANKTWNTVTTTKLYAHWIPNTYTLTLDANGGYNENGNSVSIEYDEKIGDKTSIKASRNGYSLLGYNTEKDGSGNEWFDNSIISNEYYRVTENTTLYAQWRAHKYNIRYWSENDQGETVCIGTEKDIEYDYFTLPNMNDLEFSRTHYNFLGWNIYSGQEWAMYNAKKEYTGGLTAEDNATIDIYAAWQIFESFSIVYEGNGGKNVPPNAQVFIGDNVVLADRIPNREGYIFLGWSTDPNATKVDYNPGDAIEKVENNITLYAVWKRNNTISYHSNGGILDESIATVYPAQGTRLSITETKPYRTGYKFLGWSQDKTETVAEYGYESGEQQSEITMGDKDIVLYAIWERIPYTVSFSYDEELCTITKTLTGDVITQDDLKYLHGQKYEFYLRYKKNINTDNLQVSVNGSVIALTPEEEVDSEYVARKFVVNGAVNDLAISISGAKKIVYNISYNLNGGTLTTEKTNYVYGEGIVLDEPSRPGYVFEGWYNNSEFTGESLEEITESDKGNAELFAKWEAKKYSIVYNENNNQSEEKSKTVENISYDEIITIPSVTDTDFGFSNEDYEFMGWSLFDSIPAGTFPDFIVGQQTRNLLDLESNIGFPLYAIWNIPTYQVTFDANRGKDVSNPVLIKKGQAVDLSTIQTPTRKGYSFIGWKYTDNSTDTIYGTSDIINPLGNMTLVAQWEPIKYQVKLNATLISGEQNDSGETISIQYKEGYNEDSTIQEVTYDELAELKENPYIYKSSTQNDDNFDKEYVFLGWSDSPTVTMSDMPKYVDGQKVINLSEVNDDIIDLYAIWGEVSYNYLTYNVNGGEYTTESTGTLPSASVVSGSSITLDTDTNNYPSREGYTCIGWNSDPNATEPVTTLEFTASEDKTAYATWQKKTYQITYKVYDEADEEQAEKIISYAHDQSITIKDIADIEGASIPNGYCLEGWQVVVPEGEETQASMYLPGTEIVLNDNVELCAVWKRDLNSKMLTYDANGGVGDVPAKAYYTEGSIANLVFANAVVLSADPIIPTREGYTFVGWDEDPNAETPTYTADDISTVTMDDHVFLFAVWEKNPTYRVQYKDSIEDEVIVALPLDTKEYKENESAIIDFSTIPNRKGYTFLGWDKDKTSVSPEYVYNIADETEKSILIAEENITLYAIWKKNEYTINYYETTLDNQTREVSTQNLTAGVEDILTDYSTMGIDVPEGHYFAGWSSIAGGDVVYLNKATINELQILDGAIIQLYTVWKPIEITMTLKADNGNTDSDISVSFKYGDNLPELQETSKPKKTSYSFLGYYDELGNSYYDKDLNVMKRWIGSEKSASLTAKWEKKTVLVRYCMPNGSTVYEKEYTVDSEEKLESFNTLSLCYGYSLDDDMKFMGWSTEKGGIEVDLNDGDVLSKLQFDEDTEVLYLFGVESSNEKCYLYYNSNGGLGGPSGYVVCEVGDTLKIDFEKIPKRAGYTFLGWSEDSNAETPEYYDESGFDSYTTNASQPFTALYAVWQENEIEEEPDWNDKTLLAIFTNFYAINCKVNEIPDISDLMIIAMYTDGSSRPIYEYESNMELLSFDEAGVQNLVLTYAENEVTKQLNIPIYVEGDSTVITPTPSTKPDETVEATNKPVITPTPLVENDSEEETEKVKIQKQINNFVKKNNISSDTLSINNDTILKQTTDADIKGADFASLRARVAKTTKNKIVVKRNKIANADGYLVFGNRCGKPYKLLKNITSSGKNSFTALNLKKGKFYKYVVLAYKTIGNQKITMAASKTIHSVTLGGKTTVAKKLKLNKKSVTLKKNKKFKIKAKEISRNKKLKLKRHRKLSYESSNKKIATVSPKGYVKGKSKGKCFVYVYTQNGIYRRIKITVK